MSAHQNERRAERLLQDSGLTILELLVVLALLGLMASIASGVMLSGAMTRNTTIADVANFVDDVRLEATRNGRSIALQVSPGGLSTGSANFPTPANMQISIASGGGASAATGTMVFLADGTVSGGTLVIVKGDDTQTLPLVLASVGPLRGLGQ